MYRKAGVVYSKGRIQNELVVAKGPCGNKGGCRGVADASQAVADSGARRGNEQYHSGDSIPKKVYHTIPCHNIPFQTIPYQTIPLWRAGSSGTAR